MTIIRAILSVLILTFDKLFTPKSIERSTADQQKVDELCQQYTLYQYLACPFCVKVRRAAKRQGLNIKTRDAKRDEVAKEELLAGGGKLQVPCLRIEKGDGGVEWLYESSEIINYLNQQFADSDSQQPAV